jgi:hypothetical protein
MYKYNMGGSVPRETNIQGQRHSLAYINPFEEDLLQKYRGDMPTVPGPGGVPSYYYGQGMTSTAGNKNFQVSKPQKQNPNRGDDKREREQAAANAAAKALSDAAAADADKELAKMLASGKYTKNTDGVLVATDPVVAASLARGYDKTPLSYDQAKALGADVGAGMFDPVTMTGYSDTAGQGLGTGFTLSGNKDDRENVTGTTFTNAGDFVTTGPKDTSIKKFVQDLGAIPGKIFDDVTMGFKAGFGSREEQEKKLLDAGYTREEVFAYFQRTAASAEKIRNPGPYVPGSGDDKKTVDAVAVAPDPCPEGYKLDPITQQCVIDDTIDVLNPGGQQVTDFVMPSVNPVIGQAANYTGAVAPTYTPNPLQPYAPGVAGNLLQASAPGLARTPAMRNGGSVGGIMGLPR